MTAGRPSDYRAEYCKLVIELGKQGHTVAMMALNIGTAKQTLYTWMKVHPKFMDAMREAVSNGQAYMEKQALDNMVDGKLNTALWTKMVSSRFREDYTETFINKNLDMDKDDVESLQESQLEAIARKVVDDLEGDY